MRTKQNVGAEVAMLNDLARDELVERWRKIYDVPPPKGVRQELLVKAVAWHLQTKRLGGMSAETRRLLRSAISRVEVAMLARDQQSVSPTPSHVNPLGVSSDNLVSIVTSSSRSRRRVTAGARLMREWGGRNHVVDVIEGGYVFEAKVYPSLTAIAAKITGAHWSGPRFFGL